MFSKTLPLMIASNGLKKMGRELKVTAGILENGKRTLGPLSRLLHRALQQLVLPIRSHFLVQGHVYL